MTIPRVLDTALDFGVVPGYGRLGYAARGLAWDSAIAGDLSGRTALVTGASSGIGEAACEGLARAGARVEMVVRDRRRGELARARVSERLDGPATNRSLRIGLCDLSEPDSIRSFANDFAQREDELAVLVNNAGVLPGRRERNSDGVEMTFATNVLGPFLLTELLLPLLRRSASGRVISVSSGGMYTARLDGEDPQLNLRPFDGPRFYAHAKRAEVVLSELCAERESETGVVFASMHPGWVDTPGLRSSLPRFQRLARPLLRDVRQGADTIVWLASAPGGEVPSGLFWHDRRPRQTHRLPGTREGLEDRRLLWRACAPAGAELPPSARMPV